MTELIVVYAFVAVTVALFLGAIGLVLATALDIRRSTKRMLDCQ
jgi:hypothetical protein